MSFIQAIVVLVIIISLNLLVIRIATAALVLTGMSREMARFQARSAFCTVGFTTSEAESVVSHPVRRRIIMILMLAGNVGFTSTIVTASFSFHGEGTFGMAGRVLILAGMVTGFWALSMSRWVDNLMFRVTSWMLSKFTTLEAHDYTTLLGFGEGYCVTEMPVDPGDWLVGKNLGTLHLTDAGVVVLGIRRKTGEFVGSPGAGVYVRNGDTLVVYGTRPDIAALDAARSDPAARPEAAKAAENAPAGAAAASPPELLEIPVECPAGQTERTLESMRLEALNLAARRVLRAGGGRMLPPSSGMPLYPGDRVVCARTDAVSRREERS